VIVFCVLRLQLWLRQYQYQHQHLCHDLGLQVNMVIVIVARLPAIWPLGQHSRVLKVTPSHLSFHLPYIPAVNNSLGVAAATAAVSVAVVLMLLLLLQLSLAIVNLWHAACLWGLLQSWLLAWSTRLEWPNWWHTTLALPTRFSEEFPDKSVDYCWFI